MVTFSPNVEPSIKKDIIESLEIDTINTQDRYLGLPTLVGRNKHLLFNDIKERLWKKIRGWKGSLFSFDGKEVLIKAVAQAIPPYAMSIFKLPISFCKDLTAMILKFLWGSHDGERKFSWVKWDCLCLPKQCGGLRFRDLFLFQSSFSCQSSLENLKNPEALASHILKAKYFKGFGFLDAPIGSSCFHIWRIIGWGRSLLKEGLRWTVGDGNNIRVFKDQWLPCPSTFKPITHDPAYDLRVAELLD
ncbi:hypothetical protein Dsin_022045 [Dipteronia sinensis]|uniref:Reverse transcriptase n=1 Tax=Dipteronia sinensis TaxID=43782 RepID=A0AAE0A0S4_9ROSI|nr:hypothetical protein Dsin_022045 [Dipteronia sinensis]